MSSSEDNRRRAAWSSYWSSGRLHSCASSYQGNYGGTIAAFWRGLFERIPPSGRLLDLATGNGPLPQLFWELRGGAADVDAVDLAELAPAWHEPLLHTGVRFHSAVRIEALPFDAATFDGVVSQFGFEYANREQALAECLRVARPDAHIAFVMHHAGSVLVEVGREEVRHHAQLVAEDGLIQAARAVVPWIVQARAGTPPGDPAMAARARERYNKAMTLLASAADDSRAPDLLLDARETVHGLLAGMAAGGASAVIVALEAYEAELERSRLRTAEMVSHALDDAQLEHLRERFRSARPGVDVECRELRQPEGLMAWSIVSGPSTGPVAGAG